MSRRHVLTALVVLAGGCSETASRCHDAAELVGGYVYAAADEGLSLRADGTFEHCWKDAAGAQVEQGAWKLDAMPRGRTGVTLFHGSPANGAATYGLAPRGEWIEGLDVANVDGRLALRMPKEARGRYYLNRDLGHPVCPRP
jgi:hypothetical protein